MNIAVRCQGGRRRDRDAAVYRRCAVAVYFAGLFAAVFPFMPGLSSALRSPSAY
jgi:hypothetical protein